MILDREPGYVIPPAPRASLAVAGGRERFPINRIFCIGRNYAAHAVEMGHDPNREPPFFFLKPGAAASDNGVFPYPPLSGNVHHEVEMVVALGTGGADISEDVALAHVFGYGLGLDMTRRDIQDEAKQLSRPWDVSKGFDHSAPCSQLMPAARIGHPKAGAITLDVNGERRQTGDLSQMIWTVPEIIAVLSRAFTLVAGDIIMSGTPSGVAAVERGDVLHAQLENVTDLTVRVV